MTSKSTLARKGDAAFNDMEKINAELFTLTYGTIVTQLLKDFEDINVVNAELEKMGYNIGIRLIDEFLAKSGVTMCHDFRETMDIVAKVAFRMFLGTPAHVSGWNGDGTECSLTISDKNPLTDCVELPEFAAGLWYSNILAGVIRGALEQVHLRVECTFTRDRLRGHDETEMRVRLLEKMREEAPPEDDD